MIRGLLKNIIKQKKEEVVKKRILLSVMMALAMAVSSAAFAESFGSGDVELTDRWNFGVSTSAVFPKADGADAGINIQGLLSYDLTEWLAVGLDAGYTRVDAYHLGFNVGTINAFPVLGDIIVKMPIEMENSTFVPYVVNGFGGFFSNVDTEKDIGGYLNTDVETDPAFIYKLGAGFDFYMTDSLALNFETSYQWADVDYSATWDGGSQSGTYSCDALYVDGGLKLKF